jgi:hypothetical protein
MILSICCLVLATGACSGDDKDKDTEKDAKKPAGATSSPDPKDAKERVAKTTDCTAEASTTGAHEAEWTGAAQVRTGGRAADAPGPKAVYSLADKKNRLTLYSPGPEFKGNVSLSVGNTAYSSDPADAESLDIDEGGTSANVDVTLTSIDGDTVDLVAAFTCGKPKKKQ